MTSYKAGTQEIIIHAIKLDEDEKGFDAMHSYAEWEKKRGKHSNIADVNMLPTLYYA